MAIRQQQSIDVTRCNMRHSCKRVRKASGSRGTDEKKAAPKRSFFDGADVSGDATRRDGPSRRDGRRSSGSS
jgi:hypothetical protein